MTKCDLLEKKIKNGVCVKKPLDDAATVTKYEFENDSVQGDFAVVFTASGDVVYFPTSVTVTDTQATGISLRTVILREHLRHSNFV